MAIFNGWRPKKLLEQGNQQAQEARQFLEHHGARLSEARRAQAAGLLADLDSFKQALPSKGLLTRIRLAREYVRRAYGVLHTIRRMDDTVPPHIGRRPRL